MHRIELKFMSWKTGAAELQRPAGAGRISAVCRAFPEQR